MGGSVKIPQAYPDAEVPSASFTLPSVRPVVLDEVGKATQQLGKAMISMQQDFQAHEEQMADMEASKAYVKLNEANALLFEEEKIKYDPSTGKTFVKSFLEKRDKNAEKMLGELSGDVARRAAEKRFLQDRLHWFGEGIKYESVQLSEAKKDALKGELNTKISLVTTAGELEGAVTSIDEISSKADYLTSDQRRDLSLAYKETAVLSLASKFMDQSRFGDIRELLGKYEKVVDKNKAVALRELVDKKQGQGLGVTRGLELAKMSKDETSAKEAATLEFANNNEALTAALGVIGSRYSAAARDKSVLIASKVDGVYADYNSKVNAGLKPTYEQLSKTATAELELADPSGAASVRAQINQMSAKTDKQAEADKWALYLKVSDPSVMKRTTVQEAEAYANILGPSEGKLYINKYRNLTEEGKQVSIDPTVIKEAARRAGYTDDDGVYRDKAAESKMGFAVARAEQELAKTPGWTRDVSQKVLFGWVSEHRIPKAFWFDDAKPMAERYEEFEPEYKAYLNRFVELQGKKFTPEQKIKLLTDIKKDPEVRAEIDGMWQYYISHKPIKSNRRK